MRKNVDDVRLKQTPQHGTQLIEGKEGAFAVADVLLVLNGFRQAAHDLQLFERQNAQTFDDSGDAVSGSLPLAKVVRVEQLAEQLLDKGGHFVLDGWNQRRQAVGHRLLDGLRRSGKSFHQFQKNWLHSATKFQLNSAENVPEVLEQLTWGHLSPTGEPGIP